MSSETTEKPRLTAAELGLRSAWLFSRRKETADTEPSHFKWHPRQQKGTTHQTIKALAERFNGPLEKAMQQQRGVIELFDALPGDCYRDTTAKLHATLATQAQSGTPQQAELKTPPSTPRSSASDTTLSQLTTPASSSECPPAMETPSGGTSTSPSRSSSPNSNTAGDEELQQPHHQQRRLVFK